MIPQNLTGANTSGTVNAKDSGLALGALFGRSTGSKEMILFALKRAGQYRTYSGGKSR